MRALLRRPWFGPLVALLATYVLFVALAPDTFARSANFITMARHTVIVAIASVGMTFVIVHGGIDLSVGSSVALTTVVVASMLRAGAGSVTAAAAGILVASSVGLVAGLLITSLRMAPFIVTLGAMCILRGAAKGVAHEQKIDVDAGGLEGLLEFRRDSCRLECGSPLASPSPRRSCFTSRASADTYSLSDPTKARPASAAFRSQERRSSSTSPLPHSRASLGSWSSRRSLWATPPTPSGSSSR